MFVAPITIDGKRYVETVIVERRTRRQGLYVHDVKIQERLESVLKTST
jgi:hypothetical protein